VAIDLLTTNPLERSWSLNEVMLAGGVLPVATGVVLKDVPATLWRNKAKVIKGAVVPLAQFARSTSTGDTFEESLGVDESVGQLISAGRALDVASKAQGRGSYALRRAKDLGHAAGTLTTLGKTIAKPTRKGVAKTAGRLVSTPVRLGTATVDTFKTVGKGLGKGLAADAVGTAAAGATVVGLAELGLLNQFGGDTESASRHARDFATTEVMGVTVPETDPVAAVAKTAGAFQDLSEANQERGHHGSSFVDHGKFVHDEISEELGDGVFGHAVGGTAGVIVGGVTAVGQAGGWLLEAL